MAEIKNLRSLVAKLDKRAAQAMKDSATAAYVGYTASYGLYVHENLAMKWKGFSRDPRIRRIEMGGDPAKARPRPRRREPKGRYWDPQGRGKARFLADPARRLAASGELARIIGAVYAAGRGMGMALYAAGLRLLRESQAEVPVDTGALRASGFVRLGSK